MYLSKKSDYMLLIDWVRKTERPFNMEEQHKITKKDKFILTTVLIIILLIILNWDKVEDIGEGPIGKIIGVIIVIAIIWYFNK